MNLTIFDDRGRIDSQQNYLTEYMVRFRLKNAHEAMIDDSIGHTKIASKGSTPNSVETFSTLIECEILSFSKKYL